MRKSSLIIKRTQSNYFFYKIKQSNSYTLNKKQYLKQTNSKFMQIKQQTNHEFLIMKEVFIEHNPSQIDQHYEINPNCLGQGGFAQVFQAKKKIKIPQQSKQDLLGSSFSSFQTCEKEGQHELDMGQSRAIKSIEYKRVEDKERLENQIEILSYLDHPSIVKLYETYEDKKRLYLVTDLLKGGDLFSIIDGKREATEQQLKSIFYQLIKAINYLHSQNICHRDIKLENVLFLDDKSFNIKIIDFGLAFCWESDMKREIKKNGENKKLIGTPDYMSPQMLAHDYDQKCDIWAAGVLLYMLLAGVAPFEGETDRQIMANIKKLKFTLQITELNKISASAKDLISKILVPQSQRLSIQDILSHEWLSDLSYRTSKCVSRCTTDYPSNGSVTSCRKQEFQVQQKSKKFKTTRSFQRMRKVSFGSCIQSPLIDEQLSNRSYCSQDLTYEQRPEQMTIQKINHYKRFSKLQKMLSIFSVSKLSQSKTQNYGHQFVFMDKNNDGVVDLQDLKSYLFQLENLNDYQKVNMFFNSICLSQRGYISYTQYLACVLSFGSCKDNQKNLFKNNILSQDDQIDQRFTFCADISLPQDEQHMDIFDDSILFQLFSILDKDNDNYIMKSDFLSLLKQSGIQKKNTILIQEITLKFDQAQMNHQSSVIYEDEEQEEEWSDDPRKFKRYLSRTYKGEKDGGIKLNFSSFKRLMKNHYVLLNE